MIVTGGIRRCDLVFVPRPERVRDGAFFVDGGFFESENLKELRVYRRKVSFVECREIDAMETDTKERLSARITGRVQGVGFRNFTQMRARQLGVTGWVRNVQDGSVRLEAEGPRGALEDLLNAVRDGPRMARVEDVNTDWDDAAGEFEHFRVRR